MNQGVAVKALRKSFGSTTVLKDIDLDIASGELICFLGPSGCGKTTLLRAIAGFNPADEGQIFVKGQEVSALPPNERRCGLVFQNYALFPHMTAAENIGYGLKVRKWSKARIAERVAAMLDLVKLAPYAARYPRQLSGGQQQRVAIARAMAIEPDVLLLDEPLSNLDAKLRVELRHELRMLIKSIGITTIFVTHDQDEAMAIGDRIVVMNHGVIEQVGPPTEIYRHPVTVFVADFVGQNNLIKVTADRAPDADGTVVTLAGAAFTVPATGLRGHGQAMTLTIRPEDIRIVAPGERRDAPLLIRGTVKFTSFLGSVAHHEIDTEWGMAMKVVTPSAHAPLTPGEKVILAPDLTRASLIG